MLKVSYNREMAEKLYKMAMDMEFQDYEEEKDGELREIEIALTQLQNSYDEKLLLLHMILEIICDKLS